jgi:hypothetical protein
LTKLFFAAPESFFSAAWASQADVLPVGADAASAEAASAGEAMAANAIAIRGSNFLI